MDLKSIVRRGFASAGYEIRRVPSELGENPFIDMRRLASVEEGAVVADVGANVGQTIKRLRLAFRDPVIHAFEPSPSTFAQLERRTRRVPDLYINNCALGSEPGATELLEHAESDMSSLLKLGRGGWGAVTHKTTVEVKTLDQYCAERALPYLDVLKSDTQGFDLEVIQGARDLLGRQRCHMIYLEIIFAELYERLPTLDQIYRFMTDNGFHLVCFYQFQFQHEMASWTDALFINPEYSRE